jgi:hypothetical protein
MGRAKQKYLLRPFGQPYRIVLNPLWGAAFHPKETKLALGWNVNVRREANLLVRFGEDS